MTVVNFQPVKARVQRVGECGVCGKRTARSKVFEQTVNPWNVNADGTPKTREEVRAAVRAEADAWMPESFDHKTCREEDR